MRGMFGFLWSSMPHAAPTPAELAQFLDVMGRSGG